MGFVFLLRPSSPGASRIPNGSQISSVLAFIVSLMPADDQIFAGTVVEEPTDVTLKIAWTSGSSVWVDTSPWPQYFVNPGKAVLVDSATDATHFILKTQSGVYTSMTQPAAGQTIGIYDTANQVFQRKKFLSVTGTGPWTIVCDTSNASSDTGYIPIASQRVSPWSESINDIPPALISYFDTLGPGEQVSLFFDPGFRMRRSPPSPAFYPSDLSNRIIAPILNVPSIQDVVLIEPTTIPHPVSVGTPGVLSNILTLRHLAVFPE